MGVLCLLLLLPLMFRERFSAGHLNERLSQLSWTELGSIWAKKAEMKRKSPGEMQTTSVSSHAWKIIEACSQWKMGLGEYEYLWVTPSIPTGLFHFALRSFQFSWRKAAAANALNSFPGQTDFMALDVFPILIFSTDSAIQQKKKIQKHKKGNRTPSEAKFVRVLIFWRVFHLFWFRVCEPFCPFFFFFIFSAALTLAFSFRPHNYVLINCQPTISVVTRALCKMLKM